MTEDILEALLLICWILAISKFFFYLKATGVNEPSFVDEEKVRPRFFKLMELPGVLEPPQPDSCITLFAVFLNEDKPLTIFGDAIVRAGDYEPFLPFGPLEPIIITFYL